MSTVQTTTSDVTVPPVAVTPTPTLTVTRKKLTAKEGVQQLSPMLFSDSVNPYGTERELSVQDLDVNDRANWPASLVQEDGVIVYGHRRIAAVKAAILSGTLDENATVGVIVKPIMSDQERIIAAIAENERRKTPSVYEMMLAFDALVSSGMKSTEAVKHFRKRDGSAQDAAFGSNMSAIRKACEKSQAFEDAVKHIGSDTGHRTVYNLVNASKVDGRLTVEGLEKMAARMMDGSYTTVRDEVPASPASGNAGEDSEDSNETNHGNVNNITGKKLISSNSAFRGIAAAAAAIKEAEKGEYDEDSWKVFLKLTSAIFNGVDGYTKDNPKKLLKAFAIAKKGGKA